jgi:hypothetical protein
MKSTQQNQANKFVANARNSWWHMYMLNHEIEEADQKKNAHYLRNNEPVE